ncbi:MAG TPA: trypsin-like peptidase domain-containing protein [Casimicrobiaceae bacterium]|jgi:S1-C subfamily serine protease|nr:trypsin-like peptidase domain-containing protein [Casimicrobiaceae bacterium]
MTKVTLYSKSRRLPVAEPAEAAAPVRTARAARLRGFLSRHERILLVALAVLLSVGVFLAYNSMKPPPRPLTQKDIDAAVLHTLDTNVLPSRAAKAYEIVQRSVVRVRQLQHTEEADGDHVRGVGTGVVIVDRGIILTNLHVVAGADRVQVVFFDGTESDADVIGLQPENDLAVLQAKTIPDDLAPATLRSTRDLAVGDDVLVVGFPFGIGPSASAGVVSGLKREHRSREGKRLLTNLIQFDAAANPGNSGGPLATMDGEVVGIVTAILNPSEQGVFIGIGFAVPIENAAAAAGISPF